MPEARSRTAAAAAEHGHAVAFAAPINRTFVGPLTRQANKLAQKLKMNIGSTPSRQVLFNLNAKFDDFVVAFRKSSIRNELPGEVLSMTVEKALQHSSKVKKLLLDSRFSQ